MERTNQQRELVFCHECDNEWFRHEHGLTCPNCQSEFVEVIEADHDPRAQESEPETQSPLNPLHDHHPWRDLSDPNNGNTRHWEYQREMPGGGSIRGSFWSTTSTSTSRGGRESQQGPFPYPSSQMLDPFQMLSGSMTNRHPPSSFPFQHSAFRPQSAPGSRSSRSRSPQQFGSGAQQFGSGTQPGGTRVEIFTRNSPGGFTFTTNRGPGSPGQVEPFPNTIDLNEFLSRIVRDIGRAHPDGFQRERGGMGGMGGMGDPPANPFAQMLAGFMNPANAASGDAVFTNEAFDRIVTELMEQHASGNAPGPASEAAIASLPRKPVAEAMLDDEGKAECSICMDPVVLGEQVTYLPCSHWFHHPCIAAWLKEHDTCPHCRSGITPKEGPRDSARSPTQEPLHDEDPMTLVRRESELRENHSPVGESPPRVWRRTSSGPSTTSGQRRSSAQEGSGGGLSERFRSFFGGGNGGSQSGRR